MIALGLVGAVALVGCPPSAAAGRPERPETPAASRRAAASGTALEHAVHELVNQHRGARGLAPLVLDQRISQQARLHSQAMAAGTAPFGHAGFEARARMLTRVMGSRRTAENVASNHGYRDPASEALREWLASRGHRENIEGPYDMTGVGVAFDGRGEVYFTQIFVGR